MRPHFFGDNQQRYAWKQVVLLQMKDFEPFELAVLPKCQFACIPPDVELTRNMELTVMPETCGNCW